METILDQKNFKDFFGKNTRIKSKQRIVKEGLNLELYENLIQKIFQLTSFAPNLTINEKVKLVRLGINKNNYFCPVCGKPRCLYSNKTRIKLTCGHNDTEHHFFAEKIRKQKIIQRNKSKSPEENKIALKKRKHTNLERYGVTWPQRLAQIKNKTRQTTLKKYGVSNVFQIRKFQNKARLTTQKKYGVEYFNTQHLNITKLQNLKKTIKKFIADDGSLMSKTLQDYIGWQTKTQMYVWLKNNDIHWLKKHGSFNFKKPALLYYFKDLETGFYKIGITNNSLEDRFGKAFCSKRIIVILEQTYQNGEQAYLAEQEILQAFAPYRCTNESWPSYLGGKTEFFKWNVLNLNEKEVYEYS